VLVAVFNKLITHFVMSNSFLEFTTNNKKEFEFKGWSENENKHTTSSYRNMKIVSM
jgi:hypothetical protein